MTDAILDTLRRISSGAARGPDGLPRVAPGSADQAAEILGRATAEGWRVRVEGAGTWCPADAPADLALTTRSLATVERVAPGDLVLTAQAGIPMSDLARTLAPHAARLAIDPPGDPDRTLGSVLATGASGPHSLADGPVRDQVLGITLVTGDGRVVRAGGSVVKNVAGFDLTRLAVGGFGGFGLIVSASLRLRAVPAATATRVARGAFDPLYDAALALAREGGELAVLELLSPAVTAAPDWTLLAEAAGTEATVAAAAERMRNAVPALSLEPLDAGAAAGVYRAAARTAADAPVTLRFGVFPDALPDLVELLGESVGVARLAAGLGRGGARWSGDASVAQIAELRTRLALREIPVTVERAPWPVRRGAGHFGAYREGVGRLSRRLRGVFDPSGTLVVALEGADG